MLAADRDTLALPLENRMNKSPTGLELWLCQTCNIAKLSKQDALAALKQTYKNITAYFKPRKKNPKENADGSTPRATPVRLVATGAVCPVPQVWGMGV
jgi:hypothetical protein